jgi:hypothetical protein
VRADRLTFGAGWRRSRTLLAATAGSVLLQVLMATVPWLRPVLHLSPLPPQSWVLATVDALIPVAIFDAVRILGSHGHPTPAARQRYQ